MYLQSKVAGYGKGMVIFMKINELIRKYRKEQHLTQEQVANYLGVTAPAVNKWENGISYPDITLLAPLARFLKTDVDTLLSFHVELSDMEIDKIVREISVEITTLGYGETFDKVSKLIKEYPSCDKLILYTAQILNAYLLMQEIEDKEKYRKQITAWFELVAFGENKELSNMATASLCQDYMANGNYEEAQKLLDQIPSHGLDKRIIQANLYSKQGNYSDAYKIHEEMIYQNANGLIGSLMQITQLKCKEKKYEEALMYAKLSRTVAENFELGQYIASSSEIAIALELKNKDDTLRLLDEMISGINDINYVKKSKLYTHMEFKKDDSFVALKDLIKKSFKNDSDLDFIRDDPAFINITKRLLDEE
jgi:transcriptional regulator with XRE-family HTH domain